ncbi:MAG: hypothetical protein RLZZ558_1690 [Planctomycetota bacterium]|jgi:SAM-dependent methyltransferase
MMGDVATGGHDPVSVRIKTILGRMIRRPRIWNTKWWQERLYPTEESRNPAITFARLVQRQVKSSDRVLDIGAGAGERNLVSLKGRCREVVGVDMDPRVVINPLLDRGVVADATSTGLEDASFDLIFALYVLEHIERPDAFAAEMARLLRPGGRFMFLTPNAYHYVTLLSRLSPERFHKRFNAWRGRAEQDTFPTVYALNSRRALNRTFHRAGFGKGDFAMVEVQPNYLLWSLPSFMLGALYERVVNASRLWEGLRVNVIGTFVRTAHQ